MQLPLITRLSGSDHKFLLSLQMSSEYSDVLVNEFAFGQWHFLLHACKLLIAGSAGGLPHEIDK